MPGADASDAGGAPQRPRVKICGHTSSDDLAASVAAGADAVGVIADVDVETPREVTVRHAADLLAAVPPLVTGVLVTMLAAVGADDAHLADYAAAADALLVDTPTEDGGGGTGETHDWEVTRRASAD